MELLYMIKRQAVDLLLSDTDDQKGRKALEFIKSVTEERTGVDLLKKGNYTLIQVSVTFFSGSKTNKVIYYLFNIFLRF